MFCLEKQLSSWADGYNLEDEDGCRPDDDDEQARLDVLSWCRNARSAC